MPLTVQDVATTGLGDACPVIAGGPSFAIRVKRTAAPGAHPHIYSLPTPYPHTSYPYPTPYVAY